MHRYQGNHACEQKQMLDSMGVGEIEELFCDIDPRFRLQRELNLPLPLAEQQLTAHMRALAAKNANLNEYACFLGAGAYDRYIPALIHHLTSRQEFLTAYTPYQPEISQGTLQSIFEYQTMICELTGMDVANASMYDGASALAEAALSACNATRRSKILLSSAIHPEYRKTVQTYCRFSGIEVEEVPCQNGMTDFDRLATVLNDKVAAVLIGQPNFFGIVEDVAKAAELAHAVKSMLLVTADPIALAMLEAPGNQGADIVVGEGQSLGNPIAFGGPYLGFFATTEKNLRRMPGRISGMTKDAQDRRGFVLTIQTREQHIRREKATSNICSNEALCALTAAIYMSVLGKEGLKKVAQLSFSKAHYAYDALLKTGVCRPLFENMPFCFEFAVQLDLDIAKLNQGLLQQKIIGGYDLKEAYSALKGGYLLAFTEKRSKAEIDTLVQQIAGKAGANK